MPTLQGIAEGRISLQFRRWARPTVKTGGTLLTAVGQLAIEEVEPVAEDSLSEADAVGSGFATRADLLKSLRSRSSTPSDRAIYRIRLRLNGPDPRIALREDLPDVEAMRTLMAKLDRWDAASPLGPWTRRVLEVIAARPGERAGDLAEDVALERDRFKPLVRKLKGLGLTESLEVGYRLSPRGVAFLSWRQAET